MLTSKERSVVYSILHKAVKALRQRTCTVLRSAKADLLLMASRELGNDAFKAGRFADAEHHYTDAINSDVGRDTKHLLHGNRS